MISGVEKAALGTYSITLAKALSLDLGRILPEQFISRMVSALNIHCSIVEPAVIMCRHISHSGVADGASPNTIAAIVMLVFSLACDSIENLQFLEEISFSSVKMIKKYYKLCYPMIAKSLPPNLPSNFLLSRLPSVLDHSVKISCEKAIVTAGAIRERSVARTVSPPSHAETPYPVQPVVLIGLKAEKTQQQNMPSTPVSTPEKRSFSTSTSKGGWGSLKKPRS